jgi:SAM-dependent methyltransferase
VSGKRSRSYLLEDPQHRRAEAERLAHQARLLFPLEREALRLHGLAPGHKLVDLGCGQGTFLSLIAGAFPGTRCIGLDRNDDFLAEAAALPGIAAVARCDLADPASLGRELERHEPDVAFCRFVLQHMSPAERRSMLAALAAHARLHPLRVVLADVDGASSFVEPPSLLLAEARAGLNELQARHGGDRGVGGRLRELLQEAGFAQIETSRVGVASDTVGFNAWWRAFGSLLCVGLRSRPSAQEALLEWAADPHTAGHWRAGFDVCFASTAATEPADA